jgi:hypothetical protein
MYLIIIKIIIISHFYLKFVASCFYHSNKDASIQMLNTWWPYLCSYLNKGRTDKSRSSFRTLQGKRKFTSVKAHSVGISGTTSGAALMVVMDYGCNWLQIRNKHFFPRCEQILLLSRITFKRNYRMKP